MKFSAIESYTMSGSLERGQILLGQRRYEQAEAEFRRSLADEPDNPIAHVLLAESLLGRDEAVEATAEAQKAIGLAPEFDAAHATVSRTFLQRNRFEEALDAIDQAIRLQPADADHRAVRAATLMNVNRREEALSEIDTALQIDPEHAFATMLKPRVLQSLGRLDEAEAATRETMRQRADDADSHLARGWVLLEQGQPKEARTHFRDALRLDPNSDAARAGLVESIKSTNFLYRWFLAYSFRMSRLSPRASMGLMIGLYLLVQVLNGMAVTNPAMAPWVAPIVGLYICFAVVTWIAVPLSNLLLRLHPDGRLALSSDQKRGSELLLLCLTAVAASIGLGLATGDGAWFFRAVMFLILALPVSAIMSTPRGWPRHMMFAMCGGLAAIILVGLVSPTIEQRAVPILPYLLLGSQFVAASLASARPRDQASA